MAKVKLSSALIRARGKMGNVVFRKYHDEVIMAQVPDMSGVTPSAAQTAHRGRFKLGVLYGRTVLADPVKKAIYEATAKAKGIPVFALTVADFMRAPVVDQIDLSTYTGKAGETIRITASDDFEVAAGWAWPSTTPLGRCWSRARPRRPATASRGITPPPPTCRPATKCPSK